jgi:hypothetical protein
MSIPVTRPHTDRGGARLDAGRAGARPLTVGGSRAPRGTRRWRRRRQLALPLGWRSGGEEGKGGEDEEEGDDGVVTSSLANIGSSYHSMQSTKHEHNKSDNLCPPYQTRVVCIDLAWSTLAWVRLSLARN